MAALPDTAKYTLDSAYVLIICISKWKQGVKETEKLDPLPGTKADMKLMNELWKDKYNFTVLSNSKTDDNEYYVTKEDFDIYLDEARLAMKKNHSNYNDLHLENMQQMFEKFYLFCFFFVYFSTVFVVYT